MTNYQFGRMLWNMNAHRAQLRAVINATILPLSDVIIGYLEACKESATKAQADVVMLRRKGMIE